LEKKTPIKDHSFYASYGAGSTNRYKQLKKPENVWLDISVNQMHGTTLEYINIKDIKENIQNDPNNPAPISDKSAPLAYVLLTSLLKLIPRTSNGRSVQQRVTLIGNENRCDLAL
jgi:hypothetical protein